MKEILDIADMEYSLKSAQDRARQKYFFSVQGEWDRENELSMHLMSSDIQDGQFEFFFTDWKECNAQVIMIPLTKEEYWMTDDIWKMHVQAMKVKAQKEFQEQKAHFELKEAEERWAAAKVLRKMLTELEK